MRQMMIDTTTVDSNYSGVDTTTPNANEPIVPTKGNTIALVTESHPLITTCLDEFVFEEGYQASYDRWQLVLDLIETMQENKGLGLSANQVGLPHRVFV